MEYIVYHVVPGPVNTRPQLMLDYHLLIAYLAQIGGDPSLDAL